MSTQYYNISDTENDPVMKEDDDFFHEDLIEYAEELEYNQDLYEPMCMTPSVITCRYITLTSSFMIYLRDIDRVKRWGPNTKKHLLEQVESLLNKQIPERLEELKNLSSRTSMEDVQIVELKRLSETLKELREQMSN